MQPDELCACLGISVPCGPMEVLLMNDTLKEAGLRTDEIEYVEAHGTGTLVGDPIELNSLDEVFCRNRKRPLLVGTIKSNIGHTEAASGQFRIPARCCLAAHDNHLAYKRTVNS